VSQGFYKGVTRVLQECYHNVTGVSYTCYESVPRAVQVCYKSKGTDLFQQESTVFPVPPVLESDSYDVGE
jgi:hypothetical protein